MKKGAINIGYHPRKLGFNNQTTLIPTAERYSTIAYNDIITYAAKAAAVPESSITMAMEALYDALSYFVLNGHSVQIPNIGTFSLSVRCKAADDMDSFASNFRNNLRQIKVNFLPSTELKAQIAQTSITTKVGDLTGYESQATIGIKKTFANYGWNSLELVDGGIVSLRNMTDLKINGTRLSKDFLGKTPVTLVWVEPDTNGEKTLVVPAEYLRQDYGVISVNIAKLKNEGKISQNAPFLKSLTLKTEGGGTVKQYTFTVPEGDGLVITSIFLKGQGLTAGSTVEFSQGETLEFTMNGINTDLVASVMVGEGQATVKTVGSASIKFTYAPTATGNAPITFKNNDGETIGTFNLSFAQAAVPMPSITSITSNGDPLVNGGETPIVPGTNYALTLSGRNLDLLAISNFSVPQGSTLTIQSKTATQINMMLTNAQLGTLSCTYEGTTLFSGTLTQAETKDVTVTGWKDNPNGTAFSLDTTYELDEAGGIGALYLVGTNLNVLSEENFVFTGGMTFEEYDPTAGNLAFNGTMTSGTIMIKVNNATIATIKVSAPSTGGGGPDMG